MYSRRSLCTLLAAAHVVVVICGACACLPARNGGPLAQFIRWYGSISGANSQYAFYAPEVGTQYRARFVLRDDDGRTWCDVLNAVSSPEVRLRLGETATSAFANGEGERSPERRERLVKSWAAAMLTRHPSATSLSVVVEAHDIPTMVEYQSGHRPTWAVVYQAEVRR